MTIWIVAGVGAVIVLVGLYVWSSKGAKGMQQQIADGSGEAYLRLAASIMFVTLLEHSRRNPVDYQAGTGFDTDRIYPSVLLVGRKIHGSFDPAMAREEYTNAAKLRPEFIDGLKRNVLFQFACQQASAEAKDKLMLGGLTVVQANVDEPAEELLPLRGLAAELYGDQIEADRRLLGGANDGLLAESISIFNEISTSLNEGSDA